MTSAARTVASFYWQFTGVVNQDIPLDESGKPTEFARYVGYFIACKPRFQGELATTLKEMTVVNYLQSLQMGEESRAFLRRASWRAGAVNRRSKPLADVLFETIPCGCGRVLSQWFGPSPYTFRDLVEALLLDHGQILVEHILKPVIKKLERGQGSQRSNIHPAGGLAPATPCPNTDINEWLMLLQQYILSRACHGISPENQRLLERIREVSKTLVRPVPDASLVTRIRNGMEAISDQISAGFRLFVTKPVFALQDLVREIRALPRLVPSSLFLAVNLMLFFWVLGHAMVEINGVWDWMALGVSLMTALWMTDALTYAIHLERDGWGDSTVAKAFQDHHDVPDEVGLWTLRRSVGTSGMLVLIPMVLLALAQPHFLLAAGLALFLIGMLLATQTHRFAHTPQENIPSWVKMLQKIHLMLPVHVHALHHDNLDRSWGIYNGWSNPLLDSIGFHEKYTRLRTRFFGENKPLWESQLAARKTELG